MTEMWPYRPQFGLKERIEALTDVLISKTGEQRICLREIPRQSSDNRYILLPDQFARARQIGRTIAGQPFYMPNWHEQQIAEGLISAGTTTFDIDTRYGDWRGEDAFVTVWQSDENYVVRQIDSMTDNSLTIDSSLGVQMMNPSVVPLRIGVAPEGFNVRRDTTYVELSGRFQVDPNDCIDLSGDYVSDYPQYQSLDVMTERTILITDINETIVRAADYVDSNLGIIAQDIYKTYVDFNQMVAFIDERPSALWRRRLWLHSLRGKQKTFWLPTFNDDLEQASSYTSGASTITVTSIGQTGRYIGKDVMILLNNGNRYMREITNASNAGANDILTISSIPESFTAADIELFCFISLVRSNVDVFEFNHAYESEISFPVTEVPE